VLPGNHPLIVSDLDNPERLSPQILSGGSDHEQEEDDAGNARMSTFNSPNEEVRNGHQEVNGNLPNISSNSHL
jgi:hypothetical protein